MIKDLSRAKIKFFRALDNKNTREETGLFLAEGNKMVSEGLKEGWKCKYLIGQEIDLEPLSRKKGLEDCEFLCGSAKEIEQVSSLKNPEPLMAVFESRQDIFDFNGKNGLILDGISDPGNLGTLIRTADWFGIQQILAGPGTADRFNAKALRSTMGSIFRVRFSLSKDLIQDLEKNGEKIWIADLDGESPEKMKINSRPFLLLGNESKGINPELRGIKNIKKICIPSGGSAESLNVAVAGGVLMYSMQVY